MISTSDDVDDWPQRIRWILEEFEGGSRRALGRRIDLSGQAVSAWARGDTRPSGPGLAALLEAYPELNARWLLTGEGPPRRSQRPAAWERALADARFRADGENGGGRGDDEPAPLELARAYRRGWLDAVGRMQSRLGGALEDLLDGVETPDEFPSS
jgi:transcriptional regulator with XRE-family HTH domain